jgi:hypothetical protein
VVINGFVYLQLKGDLDFCWSSCEFGIKSDYDYFVWFNLRSMMVSEYF